ncbi:MAG: site-specific DNA-methyltransferase [Chloroflexota bacterium]
MADYLIAEGNSLEFLSTQFSGDVDLTFLDPPFNQNKEYALHDDNLSDEAYWAWMQNVLAQIYDHTSEGGAIYFMQREKNSEQVLRALRETGWTFQNLIIWKKMTSAVPSSRRFGMHYQIIAYAVKGKRARVFNRLRISPPLRANQKYERETGMFVTDVWDDIRELTSGYFAGDEALRKPNGERLHKQQAPIALLLRIILSSTLPGDRVFDPFAGSGTTLVVAQQLGRNSVGVEIDPENVACIETRLESIRKADRINKYRSEYLHTPDLDQIWGEVSAEGKPQDVFDLPLFRTLDQE